MLKLLPFLTFLRQRAGLLAALSLATLSACGGGDGGLSSGRGGTLQLSLTDAPACGFDKVYVTVQKVRVHQSSSAADTDAGWSEISLDPVLRVDLLTLRNGVLATLGSTPLAAGHYTQMRLVLGSNGASTPLANSVVPTGSPEVALTTPSAAQAGIKLNVDITVQANQLADFVLDFDACKSVVRAGNSGQYLLRPVVAVVPRLVSGVRGSVDASIASGSTVVTLEQGGTVIKSTTPDSAGMYLLQPVTPGSYDLVVSAPGRATTVVTGVSVASGAVTTLSTSASGLNPPTSAGGTLAGTVVTGSLPIDATVQVTQALSMGRSITVARGSVDASTGAYAYLLPIGAPLVAPYVAAPTALSFAPDPAAAARYSLAVSNAAGTVKRAGPFTLTAGGTLTTNFSFP
ncbi:DUF4382 domain-containing protein [Mitsuaria sp. WAJ17]|uniref:DUF4382 domain-containing protein n=1 Tax=Mitsuaria sp. WAJ17 TaxID=2761452 RepID=UPI0016000DFF|nr:DUF4382 domain-containing protein [Mitsuaria sp. WAJ17]MBB2483630.1 DUF4382 domain-containing protein [Mitsuaria sp. WAJ17]